MGQCCGKTVPTGDSDAHATTITTIAEDLSSPLRNGCPSVKITPARSSEANSPWPKPYPFGGGSITLARSTPKRFFKRRFLAPSSVKHIRASLRKFIQWKKSPREGPIPEDAATVVEEEAEQEEHHVLDKNFGYSKNFGAKYDLGKEVGRGLFAHTCCAQGRQGKLKGKPLAVKIIFKTKMISAISIEDIRREVKILKVLSGHKHLVRFYDACRMHIMYT